jgi:hypothetical protein
VAGSGTGGAGGWVDDGSVVRLETSTDRVGIGTDNPGDKMVVVDGSMEGTLCYYYYYPGIYSIYSGVKGAYGEDVEGFLGRRYWSSIGGNFYYGVYGSATTTGANYGVYGLASGGSTNWAGYFSGDVHASGRVGIGTTTPDDDLHVANHIRVGEDPTYPTVYGELKHDGGGTGFIINAHAGGGGWADIHFQTNATTKMFIESAGKVGIGTTSPSEKLEVNGNLKVTGAYTGDIGPHNGAPFPRPAYDSGWLSISPGAIITLDHNIGGNRDLYFVDLWCYLASMGPHNYGHGAFYDGNRGAHWSGLTNTQIKVKRNPDDIHCEMLRVRIWVYN